MNHYPEFFRAGIQRTLQQSLIQVQTAPASLPETTRDQALHILTFALKLDEAWPLTRPLLLDLAPKMEQMGHRDDWLPYLEGGVALSQQLGDRLTEAELYLQIGYLYQLRSQFARAYHWFTHSLECFTASADSVGRARALNQLAFVAYQQRQFAIAEESARAALALLDETIPERAASYNTLGLVAFERRAWTEAETYHRRALDIRRAHADQRRTGWILQNLGNVLRNQGRYAEAIACYEEATRALAATNDLANGAIVQMNLGIAYDLSSQPTQAIACYLPAENVFRKLHDHHHLAKVLTNLGLSYLALQEWQAADAAFTSSNVLFQTLGDTSAYLNALDGVGLAYMGQARWQEAAVVFQQALTELPQIQGMPAYSALAEELQQHLAQARQALATAFINRPAGPPN